MLTNHLDLALLSALIVTLNLPFGYWRSRSRKLSVQWFLAVHTPVALVIAVRILSGVGWYVVTVPLFAGSFFVGQFVGGRLKRQKAPEAYRQRDDEDHRA